MGLNTPEIFFSIIIVWVDFFRGNFMGEVSRAFNKQEINKKVYWSPIVRWEKKESEVRIEIFSYKDFVVDLFPKFYYLTQKGIEIGHLISEFSDVDAGKFMGFIDDLIKKKLIVSSILSPQEIFFPQSYIFKNEYSEKIKYDASELKKFKEKQLNRVSSSRSEERRVGKEFRSRW